MKSIVGLTNSGQVELSELKLSCLCNKYSIPDNLKLIDKNKIRSHSFNNKNNFY